MTVVSNHILKHLEAHQKYSAICVVFSTLLALGLCSKIVSHV